MSRTNQQRRLLVIPIVHTKDDMGSLSSRLPRVTGYADMANEFWREVTDKVSQYVNGSKRIKVYQDGLPDTQEKIVDKIINEVNSPNYQLLRWLKDKGAQVLGTEEPKLLKEEYKFISKIIDAQDERAKSVARQNYENQSVDLLAKRDAYIAKRIDYTLNYIDLGILFIGAAHDIKTKLPKDIQLETL